MQLKISCWFTNAYWLAVVRMTTWNSRRKDKHQVLYEIEMCRVSLIPMNFKASSNQWIDITFLFPVSSKQTHYTFILYLFILLQHLLLTTWQLLKSHFVTWCLTPKGNFPVNLCSYCLICACTQLCLNEFSPVLLSSCYKGFSVLVLSRDPK